MLFNATIHNDRDLGMSNRGQIRFVRDPIVSTEEVLGVFISN